ncbi:tripartite tricarboxylate transporter substrate binding protein [Variovorax sp. J31P207]|uniref:Bug family tripartite tricarboxylate transporter substrate binding protein n=1 Tax=Variovorax sp. J31P207 TaxID=3053510 RepID=UPI00257916D9|nr:tripartite tricarboxylate transporter substrate binding protein [Variovorax sp. J31P207]MDM0070007.1 tripartite tricarboxylate transporter substrate binding protein [Variovorax sp. J31P207]
MTRRPHWLAGAALALLACSSFAQTAWPAKPIKLVVPFPPGGGTDFVARLVAEKLSTQAGWVIVIDNKPGAGGNIGLDAVAKSAPDGYTLGLGQTANLAINPALYAKMPFDPLKDFAPIAAVASQPVVLLVNASSPYKTLADVVAASKAKPESLRIGLAGNGTVGHLAGEMLERRADIRILNVPYKGAGPAMTDLLGNQVELNFANTPVAIPQLAGGKVRALAISSPQRLKSVPQLAAVPTVAELGYPGFDAITWTGLVAPAGTPQAVVERINSEVQKILKRPDVIEKLALEGSTAAAEGTPKQFADYIRSEHQKWGALIREANIKLD